MRGHELTTRAQLLRTQPDHPRADEPYYKIQVGPLERLPRLQSLLAYRVLHRDAPQPRQQLAFQLWPDTTEAQARTNLRQLVHSLKQTLPEADQFVHADAKT